jgi:Domain of unknown function (DUF4397)
MTKFRCCLAVLAVTAVLAMTGGVASAAPSDAQLRMRHLASDVPPVDVYMAGLNGQWQVVLKGLAFGQTSPYVTVQPGVYSVALRPAGASPDSTPAVKGTVEVTAGQAYTFTASGTLASLRQRLLVDGPAGAVPSAQIPATGPATGANSSRDALPTTGAALDFVGLAGVAFVGMGAVCVAAANRRRLRA